VDVIIIEGWCVGSSPQEDSALLQAINPLEEEQDSSGTWRRFVNEQLGGAYATLFAQLDALIFLRVPDFDAVYRWRLEQEEKLASTTTAGATMGAAQVARFVQHFERITRESLLVMPSKADVSLEFDDNHDCTGSYFPSAWRRDLI
jgi:D-glycerate 3-kinase